MMLGPFSPFGPSLVASSEWERMPSRRRPDDDDDDEAPDIIRVYTMEDNMYHGLVHWMLAYMKGEPTGAALVDGTTMSPKPPATAGEGHTERDEDDVITGRSSRRGARLVRRRQRPSERPDEDEDDEDESRALVHTPDHVLFPGAITVDGVNGFTVIGDAAQV